MPRKKKTEELKQPIAEHFVYCNSLQVKCNRLDCARNQANMPYNEVCYRSVWIPDKDGECDGYIGT